MSYGAGAAGAAAAQMIAEAIKASGAIVHVEPEDFQNILSRAESPLVVEAMGGWLKKHYRYLTAYKGLCFFAKSPEPMDLGEHVEVVSAKTIWIPG